MYVLPDSRSATFPVVIAALLLATLTVPATATPATPNDECSPAFDLDGPRLYLPATGNATVVGPLDGSTVANASVVVRFPGEQSAHVVRNDSLVVDGAR